MNAKERRRRYKLHYNLRKKGNKVSARTKSVTKRVKALPANEEKWVLELVKYGYAIGDKLFSPQNIEELNTLNE